MDYFHKKNPGTIFDTNPSTGLLDKRTGIKNEVDFDLACKKNDKNVP